MTQKITNRESKLYYATACRDKSTSAAVGVGAGGSGIAAASMTC